ncbi:hypothetical protein MMC07_000572 [Pseudocyphellaria aurata]|nr:hypothetical protein [Pseudocyphellaria aurata]
MSQDETITNEQFQEWLAGNEFLQETLPGLAKHAGAEELDTLEKNNKWLAEFKNAQADFSQARDEFLHRGSGLCAPMEQHCTLFRLAAGFDSLMFSTYGGDHSRYLYTLIERKRELVDIEQLPFFIARDMREGRTEKYKRLQRGDGGSAMSDKVMEGIRRSRIDDDDISRAIECRKAWATWQGRGNPKSLSYSRTAEENKEEIDFFDDLRRRFDAALEQSRAWKMYRRNVKAFTYHVGCPNAYEEPTRNIAELRRFHATQMPFFHKLQEDLAEQVRRIDRQQQIITCLVFRHLLEHLPERKTSATSDWRTFWIDAYIEAPKRKDHPLHYLLDEGGKKLAGELEKKTKKEIRNLPANWTTKGTVYEIGNGLYSVTSKNIHGFKGDYDRAIFDVRKDQWPKPFDDILEALRPKCFYGEGHELEGEVNWDEERKRYLSTDTSAESETSAEHQGAHNTS